MVRLLYYMMAYQTMELMEGSDTVHIRNRLITMRDRERLGEGVMSIVIHSYEAAPTCSPISVTIRKTGWSYHLSHREWLHTVAVKTRVFRNKSFAYSTFGKLMQ